MNEEDRGQPFSMIVKLPPLATIWLTLVNA
jgi:hypothetical protein